jgi:hypothetical protein
MLHVVGKLTVIQTRARGPFRELASPRYEYILSESLIRQGSKPSPFPVVSCCWFQSALAPLHVGTLALAGVAVASGLVAIAIKRTVKKKINRKLYVKK